MKSIRANLEAIRGRLPEGVSLVAVSKFHPVEALREAYAAGQRIFGESRVQELTEKIPQMPEDTEWHFIGHLQTNKVKKVVGQVELIHSVDSERLLRLIDDECVRLGVGRQRVLMQLHVAREETKFGLTPDEMIELFHRPGLLESLQRVHISGLMGMASNVDDPERWKEDFARIAETFCRLRDDESLGLRGFDTLSMGMSHDWPEAVAEGSTMVRIGTDIFGEREY